MQNKKNLNKGYIALLMLLIGVALMVLFIVRTDIFSGKKDTKSMLEQDLDAVNQVKEVKALVEEKSRKTLEE